MIQLSDLTHTANDAAGTEKAVRRVIHVRGYGTWHVPVGLRGSAVLDWIRAEREGFSRSVENEARE